MLFLWFYHITNYCINTMGPFIIEKVLHRSVVVYSHMSLFLGLSFLVATFFVRFLLKIIFV